LGDCKRHPEKIHSWLWAHYVVQRAQKIKVLGAKTGCKQNKTEGSIGGFVIDRVLS